MAPPPQPVPPQTPPPPASQQQAATASPPPAVPPSSAQKQLRGVPTVVDSGTLLMDGVVVHLDGVKGGPGEPAHQLFRYINGREVACEAAPSGVPHYSCKIGNYDLGEAVLLNGAARADAAASERLRAAEEKARTARRGIWRQ